MSNSCDPMDCSLPGFSDHGISQARILEWVATSFSSIYVRFQLKKKKKRRRTSARSSSNLRVTQNNWECSYRLRWLPLQIGQAGLLLASPSVILLTEHRPQGRGKVFSLSLNLTEHPGEQRMHLFLSISLVPTQNVPETSVERVSMRMSCVQKLSVCGGE